MPQQEGSDAEPRQANEQLAQFQMPAMRFRQNVFDCSFSLLPAV